jgi:hypothetical protein
MPSYGTIDHEYGHKLATTDPADDGPVWMVNLMKYKEVADYGDGADSGRSGRDADDEYTPTGSLKAVGAEIVYVAEVDATPLGDGTQWDRVAIVKYPTRRSFIEMQQRPDFQDKHVHKEAGMEMTFVIGCQPMEIDTSKLEKESSSWDDVEHPPDDEDGVLHVLHVIKWNEGGRERMEGYHDAAFDVRRNTARGSPGGSRPKGRSLVMAEPGIRSVSTSSRADASSWRSLPTPAA